MSDRHPNELLSAYLDGEVTTEERMEVSRHLEVCVECRGVLDDFRMLAAAAPQEPPPSVPAGLQARIMTALRAQSPEPRRRFAPWFPVPLAVAAGLVVVAAGGWALLRRRPEPERALVAQSAPTEAMLQEAYRAPASPPPPGAALPSAAPQPPAKDASDSLQSLGYISSDRKTDTEAKEKAPGAGPEATGDRPASPPNGLLSSEATAPAMPPGFDAAPKAAEASRPEAATEPRALALRAAPSPAPAARSLVFEFEGAEGTLTDSGLVTLAREGGACSVDLAGAGAMGEEVRLIFNLASAVAAPRSTTRLDETRAQERARQAGGVRGAAVPGTLRNKDERPVRLLRMLPAAQRPLDPADVEMVEERLGRLLEETAREAITARCGVPPPRSPHGD